MAFVRGACAMTTIYSNPEFLGYLSTPPGIILVSSNKCASRFLDSFLHEKKKFRKLKISDASNNDILHNETIYKKIFIYRDPVDRFIAWYNMFVYDKFGETTEYGNPYKRLHTEAFKHLSFKYGLVENILHFLSKYDIEELKELLQYDSHTVPLCTYFDYTGFSYDDYKIIDMYDLSHFTYDKFGAPSSAIPSKRIAITPQTIDMLQEIRYLFRDVYNRDYEILYPRLKKYDR